MHRELRQMMVAENIIIAYRARKDTKNWAEWANKNKKLAEFLSEIEIMLNRE